LNFIGEMGAGKTTLIKAICCQLGVLDHVQSPTFSIVNTYKAAGLDVFHFDFYRLKNTEEALDIGVEEYFDAGHWVLVEWGSIVENLLPQQRTDIAIEILSETTRKITLTTHE
jgi:tRNA threonylcarbamoyladenosine biosynthesis protein TsaE